MNDQEFHEMVQRYVERIDKLKRDEKRLLTLSIFITPFAVLWHVVILLLLLARILGVV